MRISQLLPEHLPTLHGLYLALVAQVPHCLFKPGLPFFTNTLQRAQEQGMRLFVAEEQNMVQGFAALSRILPDTTGMPRHAITSLFCLEEGVGRALLQVCEAESRTSDAGALLVFPNTRHYSPIPGYNGGWDGLSDRVHATGRLLARNGFYPIHRELHLTCDLPRFPVESLHPDVTVSLSESIDDQGRRTLRVWRGNLAVGVCAYGTLQRLSDDPETREWGYIWGLGIDEQHQGYGLARYLLTTALNRLRADGCQGCWTTVTSGNWASLGLVLSHGFEIVDGSTSFSKTLS
jgi:ribosomal protein S18 acetylase RimI-like enzyme